MLIAMEKMIKTIMPEKKSNPEFRSDVLRTNTTKGNKMNGKI